MSDNYPGQKRQGKCQSGQNGASNAGHGRDPSFLGTFRYCAASIQVVRFACVGAKCLTHDNDSGKSDWVHFDRQMRRGEVKMFKVMLAAGLMTGLLTLGACASHHQPNAGRLKAQMVNGGGDVHGTGKRYCIRKTKTGSHMGQNYCMTAAQYKEYKKEQAEEQEMFQRKNESTDQHAGCFGPRC